MEAWCIKGLGDRPYIGTREEYDKLPDIGKQEIISRFPEHAEYLTADESKLPAELRLRMQRKELLFSDQQALEDAGYVAAVQYLAKAQQQFMQDSWDATVEAGRAEAEANTKAREAEMEQLRIASQERANAAARASYIRQLHSGSSVEQPTGPVTIGK